jgi:hypothetical protein
MGGGSSDAPIDPYRKTNREEQMAPFKKKPKSWRPRYEEDEEQKLFPPLESRTFKSGFSVGEEPGLYSSDQMIVGVKLQYHFAVELFILFKDGERTIGSLYLRDRMLTDFFECLTQYTSNEVETDMSCIIPTSGGHRDISDGFIPTRGDTPLSLTGINVAVIAFIKNRKEPLPYQVKVILNEWALRYPIPGLFIDKNISFRFSESVAQHILKTLNLVREYLNSGKN